MTFKIVVLSLMLGIWGLDARSQNEEASQRHRNVDFVAPLGIVGIPADFRPTGGIFDVSSLYSS